MQDARGKWDKRHANAQGEPPRVARILSELDYLLPAQGRALDLACGRGGNALYLASKGLAVDAWDFSSVAVCAIEMFARERGLDIRAQVRDVVQEPPAPDSYDVIFVSHFLDREICPAIARALRVGGLLFYQTFVRDAVTDSGPPNPRFRLAAGELLALFRSLRPRVYHDEGTLGDTRYGVRDVAWLVAERTV